MSRLTFAVLLSVLTLAGTGAQIAHADDACAAPAATTDVATPRFAAGTDYRFMDDYGPQ